MSSSKKPKGQRIKSSKSILDSVNLPKYVCHRLVGEDHPKSHRMIAGALVMAVGVIVAKTMAPIHFFQLHILGDIIGYGIHALGAVPFIDHIIESNKENKEKKEEEMQEKEEERAEERDII